MYCDYLDKNEKMHLIIRIITKYKIELKFMTIFSKYDLKVIFRFITYVMDKRKLNYYEPYFVI